MAAKRKKVAVQSEDSRVPVAGVGGYVLESKPIVFNAGKPSVVQFRLDDTIAAAARARAADLLARYPLYPEIDL